MYRPGLSDLHAVLAISRSGSFRAAALELGMSATALSSAIGKLEAALGVRLFNRTTRSVSLSDAGRVFVAGIGPAVQDITAAMEAVRSRQEVPSGTLRINAAADSAFDIMSPLVLEYLRRYPQVHVDLVVENRHIDIVAEGFDIGVRAARHVPSDMIAVSLGIPHRLAVVGSPDYFATHPRPLVPLDLLGHRCLRIRLPDGSGAMFRWPFEKDGEAVRIEVTGPITLNEAHLMRTAVLAGVGIGIFRQQSVVDDIAAGRLIRVLEDWTPPSPGLCIYYPGRRNASAALKAFVGLARTFSAQLEAEFLRQEGT